MYIFFCCSNLVVNFVAADTLKNAKNFQLVFDFEHIVGTMQQKRKKFGFRVASICKKCFRRWAATSLL